MMIRNWRESVVEYIRVEAQPQDKFGHQPRLYVLAKTIGQDLAYDDDILFAAVWMHDLGVFSGHRPQDSEQLSRWDHVPYTIGRSRELLRSETIKQKTNQQQWKARCCETRTSWSNWVRLAF